MEENIRVRVETLERDVKGIKHRDDNQDKLISELGNIANENRLEVQEIKQGLINTEKVIAQQFEIMTLKLEKKFDEKLNQVKEEETKKDLTKEEKFTERVKSLMYGVGTAILISILMEYLNNR